MTKFTAGLLIAALCASFSANAARPSFTSLQQQINQLQSQVNQLENQAMVVRDGNGVTFGKVISLPTAFEAYVIYQWQGFDLLLIFAQEQGSSRVFALGRIARDILHTKADCSDEPWFFADDFNRDNDITITGETHESVTTLRTVGESFKIIGLANPSQTPVTITVAAEFEPDFGCSPRTPYQQPNMVQGIVELTPAFDADHPPPYTVVIE